MLSRLFKKLGKGIAVQELARRRRCRSCEDDIEAVLIRGTDGILHSALPDQIVGQPVTHLPRANMLSHNRFAKIRIDHQDAIIVLCEGSGKLKGNLGLPFVRRTARHSDGTDVLAAELNVGAKRFIGLQGPEGQIFVIQTQLLHDQFPPF